MDPYHKHILVRAESLRSPPHSAFEVIAWLTTLTSKVGMRILAGPIATICETPGYEGPTGTVIIETSHASIHVWDQVPEPYAQRDLYS